MLLIEENNIKRRNVLNLGLNVIIIFIVLLFNVVFFRFYRNWQEFFKRYKKSFPSK